MPKIDDPMGQLKKGAEKEPRSVPSEVLVRGVGWIPHVGATVKKAVDAIRGASEDSRLQFFRDAVIERLEVHENDIDTILERLDEPEFNRLVAVAVERIFFLANEKKVKRFSAVLSDIATHDATEQEYEDAASFVRALDELSEDDMRVLKHLYHHQKDLVIENYAMTNESFFPRMNDMLEDMRNLGMQPDYFFARCNRLTGYGLAIELNSKHPSLKFTDDFAFRMTSLGKRLMVLLEQAGEDMDAKDH